MKFIVPWVRAHVQPLIGAAVKWGKGVSNRDITMLDATATLVAYRPGCLPKRMANSKILPMNAQYYVHIRMPPYEAFADAQSYYATLAHESTHWTKHPSRLAREFGRKKWGDEGYAEEELVAELGSAFLCADLELALTPREDHAAYIAHWLTVLKNDKRAIFRAAAHAQRAADFLHGL